MNPARRANHMTKTTFEKNPFGSNYLLNGDGFYISYLPDNRGNPFETLGTLLGVNTKRGSETALVTPGEDVKWRILIGDFRTEYEQAFPDLLACKAVYESHRATARSDWSTDRLESESADA